MNGGTINTRKATEYLGQAAELWSMACVYNSEDMDVLRKKYEERSQTAAVKAIGQIARFLGDQPLQEEMMNLLVARGYADAETVEDLRAAKAAFP